MITFPTAIYAAMRYKVGFFFQEVLLADVVTLTSSSPTFAAGPAYTDTVSATDVLRGNYTKPFTDSVQLTDDISLLFSGGLSVNSSAIAADFGILRIQDYCDFSYFELDYVGTSSIF